MDALYAIIGPENGDASALQLSARAVILFAIGILYIRIAGQRTFSRSSPLDIIVAIIVGSNLSRAMTGKAPFVPTIAATLVFVALHRAVAMASLRWPWLARAVKSRPVVLVEDGKADRAVMRKHGISDTDLHAGLRMEQAEHIEEVRLATLEAGGKISVVHRKD